MPKVLVDGQPVSVPEGARLTAALGQPPIAGWGLSGAPRSPRCGMGQCQECRVQVGGREVLACLTLAEDGLEVRRG